MARALAIVVLVTVHAHVAHADGCPPAVALTGDDAAVRAVREQLDARGIADETPSCPVLRARIEQRGSLLVLAIDRVPGRAVPDGVPDGVIERAVGGPSTAATVIESWVCTGRSPCGSSRAGSMPCSRTTCASGFPRSI